ncbi:MAG: polysaccharide deacetylase family protein [Thermoguttaceae bacterium]|jgi:peptidoglycan/xylan/chitin deacetylase (PgdA/CDA1 family)
MVNVNTLAYHDVVRDGNPGESGFMSPHADAFKLEHRLFTSHLRSIASAVQETPILLDQLAATAPRGKLWMLSFDDGGASAATTTVDALAEFGWKAHFFVATDFIGHGGFLTAEEIRRLRRLGHLIGTHTCSHPHPTTHCSRERLLDEWGRSAAVLSDILGEPVWMGSIPGGSYSRFVVEVAAEAGLTALFTSEPTSKCWSVGGCRVFGRYAYRRGVSPQTMAALARGELLPRLRQRAAWNCKKVLKKVIGQRVFDLGRRLLLRERKVASPPTNGNEV